MSLYPDGAIPKTGIPDRLAVDMTIAEQHDWHRDFLRRHPVSRRRVLVSSAAALFTSSCSADIQAGNSGAMVGGRHVAYADDAARGLRFSGQLSTRPHPGVRVLLDHGPTPELGETVQAEIRNLVSHVPQLDGSVLSTEQFYVHAGADGLSAGQQQYYRWRTSDGFVSDVRTARTALAMSRTATPFRFTMMGDQGTDDEPDDEASGPHAANVLRQIVAAKPDFHILAGDIAYADTSGEGKPGQYTPRRQKPSKAFDRYDPRVWDAYFPLIEDSASRTPWMFTTGNHDMEALYENHGYGGHLARLAMPTSGPPGCPATYSFTYGNVAVLSLDANDVSYEIQANTHYSNGRQTTWTDRTLSAYRTNPNIDFIVCFFHHCAYATTETHGSDGGVRDAWVGLFDRYQVDLVLQGHNHVFERTDPIRGGKATRVAGDNSIVYPADDGTVYYTVGGGGRSRSDLRPGEWESYRGNEAPDTAIPSSAVWLPTGDPEQESVTWSRVRVRNYSFIRIDVRPGIFSSEMDVVAIDEHGREFDRVTYRRLAHRS